MSEMDVRGEEVQPGDDVPADVHVEAPEADVAEQRRTLQEEEDRKKWPIRIPFDADPADATDQERTVDLDEDDYR